MTTPEVENYFEYFTEIEEKFRRCRGTPTLLSTLDWALIESWKEAGIPLGAVLIGIERTFEKYARRPQRFRKVNGLAYCSQSVMEAADQLKAGQVDDAHRPSRSPAHDATPFPLEQLHAYLRGNAQALRLSAQRCHNSAAPSPSLTGKASAPNDLAQDFEDAASALDRLADGLTEAPQNVKPLEDQLAALEEKLTASATRGSPAELLVELRRQAERSVAPYRSKMNASQLDLLDRQFLKRGLYEHYALPRLSLFYCKPV
ncbi:MAG TPA: hypothetical protein VMT20_21975 [Terriglobia bacterium]|nr:hypothetical protein [Terriglobia bacterium]